MLNILPKSIINTIKGLINYNFSNAYEALICLNSNHLVKESKENFNNIKNNIENIKFIKKSIISNINVFSSDIVASDPMGFLTNKYSFAFGIFGVLYALHNISIGENIAQEKVNKIVQKFMISFYRNPNNISSGLFVGLSGIIVSLVELDFIREAKIVALLKLYKETNDIRYLKLAEKDANILEKTAVIRGNLYYWKDECGDIYTGLTRGSSGIALALLYLYLETNNERYINVGIKSLEADLSKLVKNEQGYISFNSRPEGFKNKLEVYSPYIHNGIAGLGCALLRYFLITKNKKYRVLLNETIEACDADLSLYPGYSRGMAGIMTFLQDCAIYLNSDYANKILITMAKNISFFQVSIDNVNGYAGEGLYRISHDLFTGSSGIILTLKRNLCLSDRPYNPFLILDKYYNFRSL